MSAKCGMKPYVHALHGCNLAPGHLGLHRGNDGGCEFEWIDDARPPKKHVDVERLTSKRTFGEVLQRQAEFGVIDALRRHAEAEAALVLWIRGRPKEEDSSEHRALRGMCARRLKEFEGAVVALAEQEEPDGTKTQGEAE